MVKTSTAVAPISDTETLARLSSLAAIERVEPKSLLGSAPAAELDILDRLANDGFTDAQAAFDAIFGVFGITRYADKLDLATSETKFYLQRIVQTIKGSFSKDDNWALQIVTEDGEPQILTLDMNDKRDKALYTAAIVLRQFPQASGLPLVLRRIEKSDGNAFYVVDQWREPRGPKPVGESVIGETYEGIAS